MATTTGIGSASFVQPQPSFTADTQARANTEQVQPREAPAANSQRADRNKAQARNDDQRRDVAAQQSAQSEEAPAPSRRQSGQRGSVLDVVA